MSAAATDRELANHTPSLLTNADEPASSPSPSSTAGTRADGFASPAATAPASCLLSRTAMAVLLATRWAETRVHTTSANAAARARVMAPRVRTTRPRSPTLGIRCREPPRTVTVSAVPVRTPAGSPGRAR